MYSINNPWIKHREPSVCLWKPDYIRGYISNMNTSLFTDFSVFSDRQLREYALMMKVCGFTGVQVTDMCSCWRPSGSPEFVHDRLRVFADALHENGMEFTLWCWAAEFSAHGWADPEVHYSNNDGRPARECPDIVAVFDKYYDIYASAAGFCDRVIAHFYDPGNLTDEDDVLFFLDRFAKKFREKNPNIKIGVDTWAAPDDFPTRLVESGHKDIMLMELPFLPIWREEGKRSNFRQGVKELGCELGSWGWYTCEYEQDQRPFMTVNNRVIKDVYNKTREQADHILVPSYWSEMDAYHVLNFFSMYAAGHLLINPDEDPDELLAQSAELIVGKEDKEDFLFVLELIRDARSGDTWNTYWWTEGNYILRLGDPEEIFKRAEKASEILKVMEAKKKEKAGVALPVKQWQFIRLMQPHVEQIKAYAEFRIGYGKLKSLYAQKGDCEEVRTLLKKLGKAVPEYNCTTGLWGQPEALEQFKLLAEFCKESGFEIPRDGVRDFTFKRRLMDHLYVNQRSDTSGKYWCSKYYYEAGAGIPCDYIDVLLDELCRDGVIEMNDNGEVALVDSESVRFDFSI